MSNNYTNEQNQHTDGGDPTRLVPPRVDWGMQYRGRKVSDMLYGTPGATLIGGSVVGYTFGLSPELSALGVVSGAAISTGGYLLSARSGDYSSGADDVSNPLTYRLRNRTMPLSPEATTEVHGCTRINSDGTAEMADGRLVGMARISGRDTDLQSTENAREMIKPLRTQLDETVVDVGFRLWSTTTEFDIGDITDKYRAQLYSDRFAGHEWTHIRELIRDICTWEANVNDPTWDARQWNHYVAVSVHPDEVAIPDFGNSEEESNGAIREYLFGSDDEVREVNRRQMKKRLNDRLSKIRRAFDSVSGVETHSVGPAEHALLIANYWTGTAAPNDFNARDVTTDVDVSVWPHPYNRGEAELAHRPEAAESNEEAAPTAVASADEIPALADGGGAVVASNTQTEPEPSEEMSYFAQVREGLFGTEAAESDNAPVTSALQQKLAPTDYDEQEDFIRVGDQYVRTFWLAGFPITPKEKFLEGLYTLRGVDVDVCLDVQAPESKESFMDTLKHDMSKIGADIQELREEDDIDSLFVEDDIDPYVQMYEILYHTNAQPWYVSGFVTVRAGNRDALDAARTQIDHGFIDESDVSLDLAKLQALEDACEQVTDILSGSPARSVPRLKKQRQHELFESCAPNGVNRFDATQFQETRRRSLSGTIAAAFPPVTAYMRQEGGVEAGRSVHNGSKIIANDFEPGPAHRMTCASSGSGKTYRVKQHGIRWMLGNQDRTLILCDTMGDFDGIPQLFDGDTITVDGSMTINPLHIEETPVSLVEREGIDPFSMRFMMAKNFLMGILSGQARGAEVSQFDPLVGDALMETYRRAGINPDDPTTHKPENSPTMVDLRKTIEEMGENPLEFVDSRLEADQIQNNAGPLLRKLSGFKRGGEYDWLTGKSDVRIKPGSATYIDLSQIEGFGGATDRLTILELILGMVYETVKTAPGEKRFVIDEAHYLVQSEIVFWLQKAARHWRHYNAGLWLLSHRPGDFVRAKDDDMREAKDAIMGQMTVREFMRTTKFEWEDADQFDLNNAQYEFVKNQATRGEDGAGYTDALVDFAEMEGWQRIQVEASPLEHDLITYDPDEDGSFDEYLRRTLDKHTEGE